MKGETDSHDVSRTRPPSLEEIRVVVRDVLREEMQATQAPLDTRQAARRLNVSLRKIEELVAGGELRPIRIGRKRLFTQAQLEGFLRSLERRGRR